MRRRFRSCGLLVGRAPWLVGAGVWALGGYLSERAGAPALTFISAIGFGFYAAVGCFIAGP